MDGSYEFGKPYQTWLFLGIHFKISGQWCGHAVLQQVSLVCVCGGGCFMLGHRVCFSGTQSGNHLDLAVTKRRCLQLLTYRKFFIKLFTLQSTKARSGGVTGIHAMPRAMPWGEEMKAILLNQSIATAETVMCLDISKNPLSSFTGSGLQHRAQLFAVIFRDCETWDFGGVWHAIQHRACHTKWQQNALRRRIFVTVVHSKHIDSTSMSGSLPTSSTPRYSTKVVQSSLLGGFLVDSCPANSNDDTFQETDISHLGKRKIIFKSTFKRGYVSFQEGTSNLLLTSSHLEQMEPPPPPILMTAAAPAW